MQIIPDEYEMEDEVIETELYPLQPKQMEASEVFAKLRLY